MSDQLIRALVDAGAACPNYDEFRAFIEKKTPIIEKMVGLMQTENSALLERFEGAVIDDPAHDLDHVARVFANAWRIVRQEELIHNSDMEVLLYAAIGHDFINYPKDSPKRSQSSSDSAEAMGQIMEMIDEIPTVLRAAVMHTIAAHSYSAKLCAATIEAKIFQDADRLDSLGNIGLARMFQVSALMNRKTACQSNVLPLPCVRNANDKKYALDHIFTKLEELPSLMNYQSSRTRATKLHKRMVMFAIEYSQEVNGM